MNHSSHLTDEELVAFHWDESDPRYGDHLATCPECAERSLSLARDLKQLRLADGPECPPEFADRVWERIRAEIHARPPEDSVFRKFFSQPFGFLVRPHLRFAALGSVAALLIGVAFFAGRLWEKNSVAHISPQTAQADKPHQAAQSPVVVVLLDDHLDRSEQLLVELKHADGEDGPSLAPMREEAKTLLIANRKIIQQRTASSDPQIQATLTKLDHVLVQLASDTREFTPDELGQLQDELNSNKLLFEIRVLRTTSHETAERDSTAKAGGTI